MSESTIPAGEKERVRTQVAVWNYRLSSSAQDAINFVNQPPAQGAGQAVFSVRDDGRVDTFYFL